MYAITMWSEYIGLRQDAILLKQGKVGALVVALTIHQPNINILSFLSYSEREKWNLTIHKF